jgi:hypothetical protein
MRCGDIVLNLSMNQQLQNRWTEAEQETRKAMGIYEKSFGKDHHMMGSALMGLAAILHDQKRYDDEEATLRSALAVHQKTLGDQVIDGTSYLTETFERVPPETN